jgi:predicted amidohydrolase
VLAVPNGEMHRYRKIHRSLWWRGQAYRGGDEFTQVEIDGLRVTMFVCYDLRFATSSGSSLRRPTSTWSRRTGRITACHWTALLQARAIENQAYVVGCNRVGSGGGLSYSGDSRIVDPLGELLATAAKSESILLADISAEEVAAVRTASGSCRTAGEHRPSRSRRDVLVVTIDRPEVRNAVDRPTAEALASASATSTPTTRCRSRPHGRGWHVLRART